MSMKRCWVSKCNTSSLCRWSRTSRYSYMMGSRFHWPSSPRQLPTFLPEIIVHTFWAVPLKMCGQSSQLLTPSWLMLRILLGPQPDAGDKSLHMPMLHFLHASVCLRLHTSASGLKQQLAAFNIRQRLHCDRARPTASSRLHAAYKPWRCRSHAFISN